MTIALSVLSLLIGIVIGFAFGILRAGPNRTLSRAVELYVDFFRGTPFLLQVFIVFFILPEIGIELSAFMAGVVALSNAAACFIGEIVAAGIQSVPTGQTEAAAASGAAIPMGSQAAQLYALFAAMGSGNRDFSAIIHMLRGDRALD